MAAALLLEGFILARKSARAHLLLPELLLVAGSGAPGVSRAQPRYLNSGGPGRLAAGRQGRAGVGFGIIGHQIAHLC